MSQTKQSHSTDGRTVSLWQSTVDLPTYPPLQASTTADVCVVGAGIAGLTTAYLLAKEGRSVIVLDDSAVGDGQTGRTSAHLASANDDRFFDLRRMFGDEIAKIAWKSHAAAIDKIEQISAEEMIDCDFARLDGYLFCAPGDDANYLKQELDACMQLGIAVEMVGQAPLGDFNTGLAIRFPRQARFHPLRYLNGLANALVKLGGKIHTGTHVNDVKGGRLSQGEMCVTTCDNGAAVQSKSVVVATNTPAPINDWMGIYTKQSSYRTYMLVFQIPKGSVTDALFWDTGEKQKGYQLRPYHYVRVESQTDASHDLLLVGGEDHKVGQFDPSRSPFDELEKWTREHIGAAGEIVHRWSGQVQEPNDAMAYIGEAPTKKPNVYVITGDSGMGLTHGTLGAMLITDLIQSRPNPWAKAYDPSRKPTAAPGEFVKENVNVAATYTEYLTPGEISDASQVQPGEGAILREGLKKLAIYRDPSGATHRLSCACTHLGCIVHWNSIEKTWDCPCHGSRFNATGDVIMGPAIEGLKKVE